MPPDNRYGLYIGGRDVAAEAGQTLPVYNPATGEQWAQIADGSAEDVDRAVQSAKAAQEQWAGFAPSDRARLLHRVADEIAEHAETIAELEVRDNGKLAREMRAQLNAVPRWYRYFAGLADKLEGTTVPMDRLSLFNYTLREPIGVIGCITPWNSPVFLATWKLAPALAAGNAVVLKPSEHASIATLEMGRCFERVNLPTGLVNIVTGRGDTCGAALAAHPGIGKISFTGSVEGGAKVAAAAGANISRVTLELGGKSANVVFADAAIDAAVDGILAGIFGAAGQTCVAGSRAFVHTSIWDQVVSGVVERTRKIVIGDPLAAATEMGPMGNEPQLDKVQRILGEARAEGAEVLTGGDRPDNAALPPRGLYFSPTVLTQVAPSSVVEREEVFGPVLNVSSFEDEDEVISRANDTAFGLAAGVWTSDLGRAHRMVRKLQAGTVWVNTYRAVSHNMPFGGYKDSGVGRENGIEAITDYTETKSAWIETQPDCGDPFSLKVGPSPDSGATGGVRWTR